MKARRIVFIILALAIFMSFNIQGGMCKQKQEPKQASGGDLYNEIELFSDTISIIKTDYVKDVGPKELIYGALKGMLSSLDSHSQFMDPDTYNEIKVETTGKFGGLGIEITIKDGLLTIVSPIEGTPAFNAGLKANDKIVKIDGEITRDITLISAVKKLRGEPGTKVTLTILREKAESIFDVTVTRDIIRIESVKRAEILEDGIGYIRITEFQENTSKDLGTALEKLKKDGMNSLILDLRNNPGGLLSVSVDVAEKFIEKGKMIVSTKGRMKSQNMEFKARDPKPYMDFPIVVLVNEGSASASEIVAGALQDHKRGILLGTKTFGKGSVQTVIPLRDGSALRLTTAQYFTPSGRSINGEGINPDIMIELEEKTAEKDEMKEGKKEEKKEDIFEKLEKEPKEGLTPPEDKKGDEKKSDSKKTEEKKEEVKKKSEIIYDSQLLRAIDLLKGLKVYKTISG
ncbi:MAG: peptidase S41 [Candidatus Omnitrophica bacterium CG07_land_8_20_14_0_80_42_15]|uniref:Peptidase S41 n=1 Tax=Candidatus Aquitaenariimonas noxiae TaxID=1974741 RepID=A0A2J0KUE2_9BACT|nr:MAG: peptidase S41 [Candidatus Omnitrophica bacterium CG07_land_8_20_14_0_80_42_15]